MNREEMLASAYIHDYKSASDEHFEASAEIDRLTIEEPETAWLVIRSMIAMASSDETLAFIGAGPLEDLLKRNGPRVIDDIERSITLDEDLQFAICCVWIDQKFPVCSRVHELAREFGPGLKSVLSTSTTRRRT